LGSGSTWYAVVGDKRAYNTVRNQYCGDSFIRPDGLLQVASFTSAGAAEKFANELSQTTGLSFYVKY
jgi:serine/threonine-protein kinase